MGAGKGCGGKGKDKGKSKQRSKGKGGRGRPMRGGGGAGGNWRTTKATWNPAESGTYSRRQASDRFADRNSKFNKNRQLGTWEETEGAKAEYRRGLKVNDIVDTVGGYKAMILEVAKGGVEYWVQYHFFAKSTAYRTWNHHSNSSEW